MREKYELYLVFACTPCSLLCVRAQGHVPVLISTIALCSIGSIFILPIEVGFVSLCAGRTRVLSTPLHNGPGSHPLHLLPLATSSPLALAFSP